MQKEKNREWSFIAPFFLFFLTLIVYIHNLSRSIYGGDVADFLSAIAVKGVAHPPGYPLFTVLGIFFNSLPINSSIAFKVGLISAISSSLSVLLMYLIIKKLTKNTLISIFTSLILAFYYLFWLYAELAEVFSLNVLLALLLFYFALLFFQKKENKYLYLVSFFLGLSLTNHQTIIFIFPSVLFLLIAALKKKILNFHLLLKGLIFFILGFAIYIYVPIASSKNPPVNWDHVQDINSFLRLILRKDYGTFSAAARGLSFNASSFERYLEVKHFFSQLVVNLTPTGFLLGIFGMFYLYVKNKIIFISFMMAFLLSGPLFTAYAGFPLYNLFFIGVTERFFLLSSVIFIFFIPFGIIYFLEYIEIIFKKTIRGFKMRKIYTYLFLLMFFIIPTSLFYYNFSKTNLSNVWVGDYYAEDLMLQLPNHSVLLVEGDTPLFNTLFLKYALKKRQDIEITNITGGIAVENTFFTQEKNNFLRDNKGKKVPADKMTLAVLEYIVQKRPVFSISKLKVDKGYWIPSGLAFKYVLDKEEVPDKETFLRQTEKIWSGYRIPSQNSKNIKGNGNLTISVIPSYYGQSLTSIGNFLVSEYNDIDSAKYYFEKALKANPTTKSALSGLGYVYFSKRDCYASENTANAVLKIDNADREAMILLYAIYSDCLKDKQKADLIAANFERQFKSTISNEIKNMLKE